MTAGLLDQVVIASANAGNTLLALALLSPARAGALVLSIGLAYLVMGINRAFVGDVLLALASRYDGERRDALVRDGLAAAMAIGALAAVVLLGVWALWPRHTDVDLRDLVWVAPFLPVLLLHDTGRYSYLSARQPDRALVIDLVWVGTQAASVVALWSAHAASAGGLLVAWGLGASAGATVFLRRTGVRPWRGDPRRWAVQTRRLSGWFTATALVGQFQVQAVAFLVAGQLGQAAVSGLRAAQVVLIQPVQNFSTAVMGLLVPRASRLAHEAGGPEGGPAGARLRRLIAVLALAFAGMALVLVAVALPVAHLVLRHVPKFAYIAPLAVPVSLQAGIYLLQIPFTAALRAMHRARTLFVQYVVFTATSLTGLVIGAAHTGLGGAAWGLTTGAAVGFVAMAGSAWDALRRLRRAGETPATSTDLAGTEAGLAGADSDRHPQ